MKKTLWISLLLLLSSSVCMAAGQNAQADNPNRKLNRNDVVFVRIPSEPNLSSQYTIDENGYLFFPVIEGLDLGSINATQFTTAELAQEITRRLEARHYNMRDPANRVSVQFVSFSVGVDYVVSIFGAVLNPAPHPYFTGMTLMDLIVRGSNIFDTADLTQARYITTDPVSGLRNSKIIDISKLVTGEDLSQNIELKPGDYLIIPTRKPEAEKLVSILGQVGSPGMYPYVPGMKLLDLFVKSGAITDQADLKSVRLIRDNQSTKINASGLLDGTDISVNVELKVGDSVVVPRQEPLAKVKIIALGQVASPGTYYLPEGATVLDALSEAGGLSSRAGAGKTYLIRMVDGTPTAVPVDIKALINRLDLGQNHVLRNGDVYFVPESGGIHLNQIMQNLSLFNLIDSTVSTVEKDVSD